MPFETPITIKEAVEHIHKREYLLPSIQISFVWDTEQIEKLFDSLMRGYPINSFLFWQVDRENQQQYSFYEFLQSYHERDAIDNKPANLNGERSITAVLDGQQRLTSLYIGLKGTYASKEKRKRKTNDAAYPVRTLYLNLLSAPKDLDAANEYDFRFLSKDELRASVTGYLWFEVGKVLDFKGLADVITFFRENIAEKFSEAEQKFAERALSRLYEVTHTERPINYFLEKDESLDKVLDIFVRINSGGTTLSFSDLLLSTATAEWKKLDAREEILRFVKDLNSIGDGFSVDKDFVLKSCLTLTESPIAFKVINFNSETMSKIEDQWEQIKEAIRSTLELAAIMGYNQQTLTSNNALIPIAWYLKQLGVPGSFLGSDRYAEDRKLISMWLKTVLIKRTFSGQPDNVLIPLRNLIRGASSFPYSEIISASKTNSFAGGAKSLEFTEDDLINLLDYEYGQPYTYSVLAFLYPTFDFRQRFHQDHIYPKSLLKKKILRDSGLSNEDVEFCEAKINSLANLQLLEGIVNQEKSKKHPEEWLQSMCRTEQELSDYRARHLLPDMKLEIQNLPEFIRKREALLLGKFRKELLSDPKV